MLKELKILSLLGIICGVWIIDIGCMSGEASSSALPEQEAQQLTVQERAFLCEYDGSLSEDKLAIIQTLLDKVPKQYLWTSSDQILRVNGSSVFSVAFSPDGHTLASGSRDHTVRLWNVDHPAEQAPRILRGHESYVVSVAFSPDGHTLASGSVDHTVRLWSVDHPEQAPRVLRGHESSVFSVAFSPDGHTLASGSGDFTVRLWNVDDLEQAPRVLRGHESYVFSVAFSPDGHTLASGSYDGTVRLWNVDHPAEQAPRILRGHESPVFSVAFSPDGHTLASGSRDHTVRLWNVDHPEQAPRILRGHEGSVYSVAFSPDGHTLASGSVDSTVRLWKKIPTCALLLILKALHEPELLSGAQRDLLCKIVDELPQEQQKLVLSKMPLLKHEFDDSIFVQQLPTKAITVRSSDGQEIILTPIDQQKLVSVTLANMHKPCWKPESIMDVPFEAQALDDLLNEGPKGANRDDRLYRMNEVYDYLMCRGTRMNAIADYMNIMCDSHFLPMFGVLSPLSWSGHFVDSRSFCDVLFMSLGLPATEAYCWVFSPDGYCVLSSHNGVIRVWDIDQHKMLREYSWPDFPINAQTILVWRDDSLQFAACSGRHCYISGEGRVFEIDFPQPIAYLTYYDHDRLAAFSKEAQQLYIYNLATYQLEQTIPLEHDEGQHIFGGAATSVALSDDRQVLAVGMAHGVINLINPVTREQVIPWFVRDSFPIVALAFSHDGRLLASVAGDGTIRIWNARNGDLIRTLSVDRTIDSAQLSFSADNTKLSCMANGFSRSWNVQGDDDSSQPVACFDPTGLWSINSVGFKLNMSDISGEQYLLIQKALHAPEPFCAEMLSGEQRAQIASEQVAYLAEQQRKYLASVRDTLPVRLQRLVNHNMPWLG